MAIYSAGTSVANAGAIIGGGLLTKINSTTLSGSAVAQNSVFSSTYRNYFVTWEGISNSSNADMDVRFKFYQSNGSTSDNVGRGAVRVEGSHNDAGSSIHRWQGSSNNVAQRNCRHGERGNGFMYVFNPISTTDKSTQCVYQSTYYHGTHTTMVGLVGAAIQVTTHSHTGLYWFCSSGTSFNGGIVTVYGITDPT